MHKLSAFCFEHFFDALGSVSKAAENGGHVVAFLHRDDSHLIFFVYPDEEILSFVVENSSGVGPVSTAARREEEGRVGLLKGKTSPSLFPK